MFLNLYVKADQDFCLINIDSIITIQPINGGSGSVVFLTDNRSLVVSASVGDIKQELENRYLIV